MFETTQLPAARVDEARFNELLPVPADTEVGDLVVVYSRGSYRLALVEKLGPKRISVVYTTEGALKESGKVYAMYTTPGYTEQMVAGTKRVEARNFDYYVRETGSSPQFSHSEERLAEFAANVALGRDAYIAGEVAKTRAGCEAAIADARARGPLGFVSVTRKSVPRESVRLVDRAHAGVK